MFLVTVMQLMRRPRGAKESPRGELSVNSFRPWKPLSSPGGELSQGWAWLKLNRLEHMVSF